MHTACWSQVCTFNWLNNITFYVNYCFFLTVQYFTRFSLIKFIYQPISPSTSDSSFVACLGSLRFLTSKVSQFKAPALLINFSAEKAGNNTWIIYTLNISRVQSNDFVSFFTCYISLSFTRNKKLKKKNEKKKLKIFYFWNAFSYHAYFTTCLFYDVRYAIITRDNSCFDIFIKSGALR